MWQDPEEDRLHKGLKLWLVIVTSSFLPSLPTPTTKSSTSLWELMAAIPRLFYYFFYETYTYSFLNFNKHNFNWPCVPAVAVPLTEIFLWKGLFIKKKKVGIRLFIALVTKHRDCNTHTWEEPHDVRPSGTLGRRPKAVFSAHLWAIRSCISFPERRAAFTIIACCFVSEMNVMLLECYPHSMFCLSGGTEFKDGT